MNRIFLLITTLTTLFDKVFKIKIIITIKTCRIILILTILLLLKLKKEKKKKRDIRIYAFILVSVMIIKYRNVSTYVHVLLFATRHVPSVEFSLQNRNQNYLPTYQDTVGSFFLNPHRHEIPIEHISSSDLYPHHLYPYKFFE